MKTIEETAKEMQDTGHVWTDLGWIKERAVKDAKEFLNSIQGEDIESISQAPGYGIRIDFTSRAYGWGNPQTVSRVFN
jgi:hypothetical protein